MQNQMQNMIKNVKTETFENIVKIIDHSINDNKIPIKHKYNFGLYLSHLGKTQEI